MKDRKLKALFVDGEGCLSIRPLLEAPAVLHGLAYPSSIRTAVDVSHSFVYYEQLQPDRLASLSVSYRKNLENIHRVGISEQPF